MNGEDTADSLASESAKDVFVKVDEPLGSFEYDRPDYYVLSPKRAFKVIKS